MGAAPPTPRVAPRAIALKNADENANACINTETAARELGTKKRDGLYYLGKTETKRVTRGVYENNKSGGK